MGSVPGWKSAEDGPVAGPQLGHGVSIEVGGPNVRPVEGEPPRAIPCGKGLDGSGRRQGEKYADAEKNDRKD